jgi:hypothetical protein
MINFLLLLAALIAAVWTPYLAGLIAARIRYNARANGGRYNSARGYVDSRNNTGV